MGVRQARVKQAKARRWALGTGAAFAKAKPQVAQIVLASAMNKPASHRLARSGHAITCIPGMSRDQLIARNRRQMARCAPG
jgi:hypothetical protein